MNVRQAWIGMVLAGLLGCSGCPAPRKPPCPDCRMDAGDQCGEYTLLGTINDEFKQGTTFTDRKLVITYERDGQQHEASLDLANTPAWTPGEPYQTGIKPADFPDLCNPTDVWSTAKAVLRATADEGGGPEQVENEVPIK